MKEELDEPPTLEEVIKATDQLKGGKTAGVDGILPEILSTVAKHFTPNFMNSSYAARNREITTRPPRRCHHHHVQQYKKKGEKSDCSNYKGVTLLSIAGKIFSKDWYPLLQNTTFQRASSELTGVSPTWSSSSGNSRKKCRQQNNGLYVTFVDLTKALELRTQKAYGRSWSV
jgi:hypothetical protein